MAANREWLALENNLNVMSKNLNNLIDEESITFGFKSVPDVLEGIPVKRFPRWAHSKTSTLDDPFDLNDNSFGEEEDLHINNGYQPILEQKVLTNTSTYYEESKSDDNLKCDNSFMQHNSDNKLTSNVLVTNNGLFSPKSLQLPSCSLIPLLLDSLPNDQDAALDSVQAIENVEHQLNSRDQTYSDHESSEQSSNQPLSDSSEYLTALHSFHSATILAGETKSCVMIGSEQHEVHEFHKKYPQRSLKSFNVVPILDKVSVESKGTDLKTLNIGPKK